MKASVHLGIVAVLFSLNLQVSWCKLELEVGSSKNISSAPAQIRQDTPPLAVAALNLKIAVNPQVASCNIHQIFVKVELPSQTLIQKGKLDLSSSICIVSQHCLLKRLPTEVRKVSQINTVEACILE